MDSSTPKGPAVAEKIEAKNRERHILTIVRIFNKSLARQRHQDDPVMRYTLFVEKFAMAIDCMTVFFEQETHGLSPDVINQARKVGEEVEKELNSLMDWIRTPHYSPDHAVGTRIMERSEKAFEESPPAHQPLENGFADSIATQQPLGEPLERPFSFRMGGGE